MKILKKGMMLLLTALFLFSLQTVGAVEVIQVEQPKEPKTTNPFSSIGAFFKSGWFWWGLLIIILVIVLGIVIYFLVKWAIQHIKLGNDLFYRIRKERIKLASSQKRLPVKKFTLFLNQYKKNIPIRLVRKDNNGRAYITQPFGYYRGDFQGHEGNLYIAFNMQGNHYLWGLIPRTELLIIPNKKEMTIRKSIGKGQFEETKIKDIPIAEEIVQFNTNEILIYADGISNTGYFYFPVLKANNGKIIDLSVPIYAGMQEIAVTEMLYSQTDMYARTSKKIIELNPSVRYITKTGDMNQSVEVPTKAE